MHPPCSAPWRHARPGSSPTRAAISFTRVLPGRGKANRPNSSGLKGGSAGIRGSELYVASRLAVALGAQVVDGQEARQREGAARVTCHVRPGGVARINSGSSVREIFALIIRLLLRGCRRGGDHRASDRQSDQHGQHPREAGRDHARADGTRHGRPLCGPGIGRRVPRRSYPGSLPGEEDGRRRLCAVRHIRSCGYYRQSDQRGSRKPVRVWG
jgi:hypothetical protein